jgi:hypothetical protein
MGVTTLERVGAVRERRLSALPWLIAAVIAACAAGTAYGLLLPPRHEVLKAVPDTLRVIAAAVFLFAACGLGVTRLLLPASLRRHELLWVLPAGACTAGLALMALGFCGVPFTANLIVVLLAGLGLSAWAVRRDGWPERHAGLAWPAFLAAVVAGLAVAPMVMELHFATVTGTGSDAHMAAGTANFLQHAYPTAHDDRLPVDRMPLLWKSKFPIYYAFAAVAKLAGLATWQTLVPLVAVLLALAALGMFLFARELLGAPVAVAACAMGFAGLDRMILHTGLNPYFNQTWGYVAMPFALVLGWWLVRPGESTRRRTAVLLLIFIGVCALAYPLALPIAGMPVVVMLWRERRRRRAEGLPVPRLRNLYRGPRSLLWMVPAVLVLLIPVGGVVEKLNSGLKLVLDPSQSLVAWAADLRAFIPMSYFINLPDQAVWRLAIIPIVFFAFRELRREQPRALYLGLGIVLAVGLFEAGAFRQRAYGYYFDFKILAFIAPLLLVIATVHAGRWRRVGPWVLAAFAVATGVAARAELHATGLQLGKPTVALAGWARALPPDASVRLDMTGGQQLWGAYFLAARRTCSAHPLIGSDYPHVARSVKADYVVVSTDVRRPRDAVGAALRHNDGYSLYRLSPAVPGPDRCSYAQHSRVTQQAIQH